MKKLFHKFIKQNFEFSRAFTPTPTFIKRVLWYVKLLMSKSPIIFTGNYLKVGVSLHSKRGFTHVPKMVHGFTFVELIVVLAIFSAIAGVILFNYRSFSSTISLRNLAQDIALQIATAQRKAVAGTQAPVTIAPDNCPNQQTWAPSYGVYFNKNNQAIIPFIDANCDDLFNIGEDLDTISLTGSDAIDQICINKDDDGLIGDADCTLNEISIVFRRPSVSAIIIQSDGTIVSDARITIIAVDGKTRDIIVRPSGQIITR